MGIRTILALLPVLFLASCETVDTEAPPKKYHLSTYRDLENKPAGLMNRAHIREADPKQMERYKRVIIEDVRVIPYKRKNPKEKVATRQEAEELAEMFEDILEAELGKYYEITRYRSYSTLSVRAALTELEPSNPAMFAVNYLPYAGAATTGLSLVQGETLGAGTTTFEAEVVDSRSRRQLFAIVDQFKGSKLQPSGLEKWGQAKSAMKAWAKQIRKGIQANEDIPSSSRSSSSSRGSSGGESSAPKPFWSKPKKD